MTTSSLVDGVVRDVRVAVRTLLTQPAFAAVVVISLTLAIGATTALFSVVNSVVLRPLPFRHADRTVSIWQTEARAGAAPAQMPASFPAFRRWRAESRTVPEMAGMQRRTLMLARESRSDAVFVGVTTAHLFPMLGIQPTIGRTFHEHEDHPGAEPVALLAERLYRNRFGADPAVLGTTVRVGDSLCTIVGVVPDVEVPDLGRPEVWLPVSVGLASHSHAGHTAPAAQAGHAGHGGGVFDDPRQRVLTVIGQRASNVTLDAVRRELTAISAQAGDVDAQAASEQGLVVEPIDQSIRRRVQRPLVALVVAAGLIFLIACTNVTSLVMTRLADRRHELGVRVAVGSSRGRLAWQVLVEPLVLAIVGAAAGWLLASWLLAVLVQVGPVPLPRRHEVSLDRTALAFAIGLSALTALLLAVAPLHAVLTGAPREWLLGNPRTTRGGERRRRRLHQVLHAGEIALSVTLLIGVGLAVRSFWKLKSVELGFQPDGVVVARVDPPSGLDPQRLTAFYEELVTRLSARPGVQVVGATGDFPLHTSWWTTAITIDNQPWPDDQVVTTNYARVAGDYFGAMRIPLRAGRLLGPSDRPETQRVAVINEAFATRFFPNGRAIGARMQTAHAGAYEIVGIVSSTVQRRLSMAVPPHFYIPFAQHPRGSLTFAIRTSVAPSLMADTIASDVAALSKDARLSQIGGVDRLVADAMAPERYLALLLSVVGAIAAALVIVGVYGLTAHMVAWRTSEIGMRLTLGASPSSAMGLVLRQCLWVVAVGVLAGMVVAMSLTTTMRGLIFGIAATDIVTFAGVPILVLGVAMLAAWIPARRASVIDPLTAIRYE